MRSERWSWLDLRLAPAAATVWTGTLAAPLLPVPLLAGAAAGAVLAAVVSDGQQVAIGVPAAGVAGGTTDDGSGAAAGAGPVDLNAATAADLDALPGIGPVLAQRIVEHRERNGPFQSVEQLDDVPGIGPATYAELAELVAV